MPIASWKDFFRVRTEASFEDNQTTPATSKLEWNHGASGGATGWMDLPVVKDNPGFQPKQVPIYPTIKSGVRAMNTALPIAGAHDPALGTLDMVFYPELLDRILYTLFGGVARTPTAGAAAKSAVLFASLATLDTQPNGTEVLKFVIASSTAASSAVINIIQNAVTVESITIGTSASSVDGSYYSKGAYNGSVNAITFSVSGSVNAGTVTVSGVDYSTNVFTQSNTTPTLQIESGGRPEAGSGNSEFHSGVTIPTLVLTYDRNALDGLLMANATVQGLFPITAAAGTFANDAAAYYKPMTAWNAAVTVGGVAYAEVVSLNMTLQSNNALYNVSSGAQKPSGKTEGEWEVFGTMSILPADDTRWGDYKNNTVRNVAFDFLTPHYVVDTTPFRLLLQMTQLTFQDYTRTRPAPNLGADLAFRGIYNTTDSGSIKATTRCRMPT